MINNVIATLRHVQNVTTLILTNADFTAIFFVFPHFLLLRIFSRLKRNVRVKKGIVLFYLLRQIQI